MFVLDKAGDARHHGRNENARSLKEEGIMSRTASPVWRVLGVAIGVVALQALMVAVFAWPATKIEPRDLPVAVAGPAPAAQAFAGQLDRARPAAWHGCSACSPTRCSPGWRPPPSSSTRSARSPATTSPTPPWWRC